MSESDASPVAILLQLPAGPDLLERWTARTAADAPDPFAALYGALLQEYATHPRRALEGVLHASVSIGAHLSPRERALLWRMEANARIGVGELDAAVRGFRHAFDSFKAARQKHEQGRTTIGWVYALGLQGNLAEARRVASHGRRLLDSEAHGDRARLEANEGNALLHAGRLREADACFIEAQGRFRRLRLAGEAEVCRLNRGMNAWMRADVAGARRHLHLAKEGLASHSPVLSLYAETGLAAVELATGVRGDGWSRLQELRARFKELGDERAIAWSHQEIAALFCSLGAYEAAAPESEQAWKTFRRLGYQDEAARSSSLRGRILATLGGHQLALSFFDEARRTWQSAGCTWAARLVELERARVLARFGEVGSAVAELRALLPHFPHRSSHAPLVKGALAEALLAQGDIAAALRFARGAYRESTRYPVRWERPGLALLIATALTARSRQREAATWIQRSTRELESLLLRFGDRTVRLHVGESRDRLYHRAIDLVLEHDTEDKVEHALDLVSRARAPVLLEDLHAKASPKQRGVQTAVARLRDELLGQDGLRTDVRHSGLARELEQLVPRATTQVPSRSALRRAFEARGAKHWKAHQQGRQVLIFDRAGDQWRVFVVRPDGTTELRSLPDLPTAIQECWVPLRLVFESVAHAPATERKALLDETASRCQRWMETLAGATFDPLGLQTDAPVLLIPTSDLHALPLEALLDARGIIATRLPHPALLAMRPRPRDRKRALLLHDGRKATREETDRAARLLSRSGWQCRVGSTVSELAGDGAIDLLHVAAHGIFHRETWLLSGIRLSDGWAGFEHLSPRRLRGALLHFTSCESGRTALFPGSDLDGWMTAGLAAGAAELNLTLWKVDDTSARAFSEAFYRRWTATRNSGLSAFQARRRLRSRWPHPYRWAPYFTVS
ncbi:MAG: CHAT domain-containing protein [Candidatus Eisenbacteria bacterium]|uniref:CHAT domain-containing protein n=1 Tax=Eiseniibacteriota bacterium TaxID=2212470 RepID=A0A956LZY9_UNCEI|nr:CHAT domain-containing protein [Candidatus Eisenbacteria bacterium]